MAKDKRGDDGWIDSERLRRYARHASAVVVVVLLFWITGALCVLVYGADSELAKFVLLVDEVLTAVVVLDLALRFLFELARNGEDDGYLLVA